MTDLFDDDRNFALLHAPFPARAAISALWTLDQRLGAIVAGTTQPMVGQMRMTWWHEALTTLKTDGRRGEPVLDALADNVLGRMGIDGVALARLVEGWEVMLDPLPLGTDLLATYADARGSALFSLTARLLGRTSDDAAGRGWALADFAGRCSDPETATRARAMAAEAFAAASIGRLPRPLRILARLAAGDIRRGAPIPRTFWRLVASIR